MDVASNKLNGHKVHYILKGKVENPFPPVLSATFGKFPQELLLCVCVVQLLVKLLVQLLLCFAPFAKLKHNLLDFKCLNISFLELKFSLQNLHFVAGLAGHVENILPSVGRI